MAINKTLFWAKLCLFFIVVTPKAQAQKVDAKVASLFVYNFINYIQWPEPLASKPEFIIGVLGDSPNEIEFRKLAASKKTSKSQSIKVLAINDLSNAANCHILYVPLKESGKIKEVASRLSTSHVLIISEKTGLGKKGSHINLFIDDDDNFKTKFELNKAALEKNGLKVPIQLAGLAANN